MVYVAMKNVAQTNQRPNDTDFLVVDSSGATYAITTNQTEANIWRERAVLAPLGQFVPPGRSIDTGLLFDVAVDASGFKLKIPQMDRLVDLAT